MPRSGILRSVLAFPSTSYEFYVKVVGTRATGYVRFYDKATFSGGQRICDSGRVPFSVPRTGR